MLLKYSPRRPYEFCQYVTPAIPPASFATPILSLKSKDGNGPIIEAVTSQAVVSATIRPLAHESLQQAVHDSGGMANLLFMFAKVCVLDCVVIEQIIVPW